VRRRTAAALGALSLLVLGTAGAGTLVAVRAGEALPGTTVAGVDVGGLGRVDIRERLEDAVENRTRGRLELVHEEARFSVDRAQLAIDVDLAETADRAVRAGRDRGLDRVTGPLLGRGEPVDLSSSVDAGPLRAEVARIAGELDRAPSAGGIAVDGRHGDAGAPGRGADAAARAGRGGSHRRAADRPQRAARAARRHRDPGTTAADAEAVAARARALLAEPLRLSAPTRPSR
jgi:hypothetical protein